MHGRVMRSCQRFESQKLPLRAYADDAGYVNEDLEFANSNFYSILDCEHFVALN